MTDDGDPTSSAGAPLAAIVAKPRAEVAIESLREEGVYDDSRRVREDGDGVVLPVTEPPAETAAREVVRQVDPEPRRRDLADLLAERGWSEAEIESAPSSWAVIGSVVLVRVPADCPDEGDLGEALLALHGEADSVLADEGIATDGREGTYRVPRTRPLAGASDTETIHAEHGTRYVLDPAEVMFSPGNQAERVRMGEVVDEGERVFDMFAGIGHFALPMARAGARVTAAEVNPTAFRYLLEGAVLNGVDDRIDPFRADCRDVADAVAADRVVMGYYGVGGETGGDGADGASGETDGDGNGAGRGTREGEAREFLPSALAALRPGGVVHYHEATPERLAWDRPVTRLEGAVERAGRSATVLEKRRVKSHSAGVVHVVVDARVE